MKNRGYVISPDIERDYAYDAMAPFYARYWGKRFVGSAKQLFSDLLLRQTGRGAQTLDLCCGTGDFAEWLDAKGIIVTGVDNSACMLACARTRVPHARFYKADMRAFELPCQFDFVTCFYNSMNQMLTLADLRRVLRSVRRHLRPGGRFLFDVVEEHGYIDSWEADEVVHVDGRRCEVRYRYDQIRGIALGHVSIGGMRGEQKQEFVIRQRPFALWRLLIELEDAGFMVESVTSVGEAMPVRGRHAVLARITDSGALPRPRKGGRVPIDHHEEAMLASHQDEPMPIDPRTHGIPSSKFWSNPMEEGA